MPDLSTDLILSRSRSECVEGDQEGGAGRARWNVLRDAPSALLRTTPEEGLGVTELRKRAVKLLKSFAGVTLCAVAFSLTYIMGTPASR